MITALASDSAELRLDACVDLRDLGPRAAAAVPHVIEALEDDRFVKYEAVPDPHGGGGSESYFYVSNEALLTLGEIAPEAAPDAVARALVRLHGRNSRIDIGHGSFREVHQSWTAYDLKPFGRPLVDALKRLASIGTEDERAKARTLLQTLDEG